MQVYKTFLKISIKNITSCIMYFVIFTSLSFVVAKVNSKSPSVNFTAEKISVGIVDHDNSDLSKALVAYVSDRHNVKELLEDEKAWADDLFYHNVEYILVIDEGFQNKIQNGDYENALTSHKLPSSNSGYIITSQIEAYLSNLCAYIKAGTDFDTAATKATSVAAIEASVTLPDNQTIKDAVKPVNYFFTFTPYVMVCVLFNSMGPMLIIWNRTEVKNRTEISATPMVKRTFGIIGAVCTFAIIVFAIFMNLAAISYKADFFNRNGLLYTLNAFAYLLVCVSITFLLAQFSKKPQLMNVWSNVFGLSTSFLCGVFVGRSLLPDKVIAFSKCLPTYWYINVTEELKFADGTLSRVGYESIAIQLLYAAAIAAVGFAVIQFKRKKSEI